MGGTWAGEEGVRVRGWVSSQAPGGMLSTLWHLLSWTLFCLPESEDLRPGLQPSELGGPHSFVPSTMLAKYYLHRSSRLVGEMETKLIHQEMYYYEYS